MKVCVLLLLLVFDDQEKCKMAKWDHVAARLLLLEVGKLFFEKQNAKVFFVCWLLVSKMGSRLCQARQVRSCLFVFDR